MGKPHPVELRERAVRLVEQGITHTEAARRLCVSIKFINDMVRLKHETGLLEPKPQGNPGRGKLTGVKGWVERRIAAQPDLTIDELTAELAAEHGVKVHRSSVGRLLLRLGLSHKKKTYKRLNRSARTWPTCAASGSVNASPSWPGIWKGWYLLMRHRSRRTWPRPLAGPLADSAWLITHRSRTGAPRLSSAPCAMTALMPPG